MKKKKKKKWCDQSTFAFGKILKEAGQPTLTINKPVAICKMIRPLTRGFRPSTFIKQGLQ